MKKAMKKTYQAEKEMNRKKQGVEIIPKEINKKHNTDISGRLMIQNISMEIVGQSQMQMGLDGCIL